MWAAIGSCRGKDSDVGELNRMDRTRGLNAMKKS